MLICSITDCVESEKTCKIYSNNCKFNKVLCKKHYEQLRINGQAKRTIFDKNEIEVYVDHCKMYLYNRENEIIDFTIFDISFLEEVKKYKWYRIKDNKTYYARTYLNKKLQNKHNKTHLFLHQLILPCKKPMEIDHRDRNGLNNVLKNIRAVTRRENCENRSTNTSGYIGVVWHKYVKKWQANIRIGDKRKHLGYFTDIKEANEARILFKKENSIQ